MSQLSNKNPSKRRRDSGALDRFVGWAVSNNDIFVLYISGLLVVIGASLMSGLLPFESWQQATLISLILSGFFAVASTVYVIAVPAPSEIETKTQSRIAINLLKFSVISMWLSWLLILFSTVALVVLVAGIVGILILIATCGLIFLIVIVLDRARQRGKLGE